MSRRVGLLGYGMAGEIFHAPFIATTAGLELAVVLTGQPERAERIHQRYPSAQVVDSMEKFWKADPEVVVVAVPNQFHVELALQAIQRSRPVVVDKPLAPSLAEARLLVGDSPVFVFQNRRWDGDFLTVQKLLSEGRLGHIFRFESRFERWRPQAPAGNWREDPAQGGLLLDLGSHLVDQAIVLFGRPRSVYAEIEQRRKGPSADDDCFVALEHDHEVRSHLWMGSLARLPGPRFRLSGQFGAFQKSGMDPQQHRLREGHWPGGEGWGLESPANWGTLALGEEELSIPTEPGDYGGYYRCLTSFLNGQGQSPPTLEAGLQVLEILEAARTSAREKRLVLLN